ncbi:hypothetical protein H6P81_012445 [Aristolochia fimbriata]|uniref:Uncharacterized protein n=1 Tax=Aristolochia fimbriata TaxID=158543 RepID=A0AAV7EBT9_ARIFI|nr:hypothetical protein H6P81_012445 [Aristolochia fimbriata]
MAYSSRRPSLSLPGAKEGMLARVSNSPIVQSGTRAVSSAASVAKKLARSTGNAAWIAATTSTLSYRYYSRMEGHEQFLRW